MSYPETLTNIASSFFCVDRYRQTPAFLQGVLENYRYSDDDLQGPLSVGRALALAHPINIFLLGNIIPIKTF